MLNLDLPKKNGLFITGTDTGVGKTLIAGRIAQVLRQRHLTKSGKYYYGKAERDERFFLWMRSQPKDDVRQAWERADKNKVRPVKK